MKKALIVAAHPDDDILGCGGIISKFRGKVEFRVVFIAEGTTCRYDSNCDECEIEKELSIRKNSALEALEFLGVSQIFFNDLPCGKLDQVPQLKINKIIESHILDFKPDTVFTHWSNDSNTDHKKVHDATIIATRPGHSSVDVVLCYEILSSTEWNFKESFNPNFFFDISEEDVANKCSAFKYYYTESKDWPYPRCKEGIEVLSKLRGMQSGFKYAEAFGVLRICK